jgi:hypothetical protein
MLLDAARAEGFHSLNPEIDILEPARQTTPVPGP